MASERKPSSYSERGKIRSTEELETYGVWVKSEPQDVASEMAGAMNFGEDAVPFDAGFDMGYDDMGIPVGGRGPSDGAFDSFGMDGFADGGFTTAGPFERADFTESGFDDDGLDSGIAGAAPKDASAEILLKIADELSSIKSELDILKKEVAEIRGENDFGEKDGVLGGGFFFGEDDGKISLTDNEMNNILASGFQEGRDGSAFGGGDIFGSLRDEDAAALKKLSLENESLAFAGETEEDDKEIDFGLGLDDDDAETDAQDCLLGSESGDVFDTDLGILTGEGGAEGLGLGEDDVFQAFADELPSPDTLDDVDELRDLRMHGADPLTPPPEDSSYLEDDPFAMTEGEAEGLPDGGDVFGLGDQYSFDAAERSLEGEGFADDLPAIDEAFPGGLSMEEDSPLDDAESLPPWMLSEEGLAEVDIAPSTDDEVSLDDVTTLGELMDLDDGETVLDGAESLPPWLLSEEGLAEVDVTPSTDDEMSLEDAAALDGEILLDDGESLFDDTLSLDDISSFDDAFSLDDELVMDDLPPIDDAFLNEASALDEEIAKDETPADLCDDGSTLDDISLEMESFEIDDPAIEDPTLMREIPETFKVDAEEALVSFDDDLEAIAEEDEVSPPAAKPGPLAAKPTDDDAKSAVSQDLRKDLKGVLAYMDQLLESLPEDKIEEFAKSEHFDTYRKVFKELGLVQ